MAVRPNLTTLREVAGWWKIAKQNITPQIDDADFAMAAAGLLPPEPWSQETWGAWTNEVKKTTGRTGKNLFMPLRLALTGMEHGPELKTLLPLIGRERAQARLLNKAA